MLQSVSCQKYKICSHLSFCWCVGAKANVVFLYLQVRWLAANFQIYAIQALLHTNKTFFPIGASWVLHLATHFHCAI